MKRGMILTLFILLILFILGCGNNGHRLSTALAMDNSTNTVTTSSSAILTSKNLPLGVLPNKRTTPLAQGALQGKTVIISPGHGYIYKSGSWTTQRGITQNLIEDIHTNEIVIDFLLPYLTRAGAKVFSCRERSFQSNEVIVDNDQGAPTYTETGTWTTSTSTGYQGKTYRYARTTSTSTATATFRPQIPDSGMYPIYVYYRTNSNRPTDGLFRVVHSGGTTDIRVDQTKNGSRWLYIGEFYFDKGTRGSLTLINQSSVDNKALIADAVRFGGGIGPSGRPRWKEGADVWVPFVGAPLSQYGDVNIRGQYADWQGGDLFLSIHTNAAGGTGTSSFIHSYAPSAGSSAYRKIVHDQLINDIRALVDPNWVDRGKKTANFGELRNTKTMPAMLVEIAFHDRAEDATRLRNNKFRHLSARAFYKGVARYLAPGSPVSPLPPTHLSARNTAVGEVTLSWKGAIDPIESSAKATSYIVYVSNNGRGFDNGTEVQTTSLTIKNLTPSALYFFRVTGVNKGGESLFSETLTVRVTPKGQSPKVLLVSGFDREDRFSTYKTREFNDRNYTIYQGSSMAKAGYFFDCVSNEALDAGTVSLKNYKIVNWILGEESTKEETFSNKEQTLVKAFLNQGGSLLVSGSEIAWDLGAKGNSIDKSFLSNYLHVSYLKDSAKTYTTQGATGALSGLASLTFDNGTHGTYNVDYADVIGPTGGATSCLKYSTGGVAGIQYKGSYKVIFLAFPIETITSAKLRDTLMEKSLAFLK